MKVGILGAGVIGTSLGRSWITAGHEVVFGVRDKSRPRPVPGAAISGLAEAVVDTDVTVLAIPSAAIPDVAAALADQLAGRVVIDPSVRFSGQGSPVMNRHEELSSIGVRYVRAFNTQGQEVLDNPIIEGHRPDQFFTADDDESREIAYELIADAGLRPVFIGGSDRVNIADGVTRLWFSLAIKQELGRHLSFRLLND